MVVVTLTVLLECVCCCIRVSSESMVVTWSLDIVSVWFTSERMFTCLLLLLADSFAAPGSCTRCSNDDDAAASSFDDLEGTGVALEDCTSPKSAPSGKFVVLTSLLRVGFVGNLGETL